MTGRQHMGGRVILLDKKQEEQLPLFENGPHRQGVVVCKGLMDFGTQT